MNKKHIGSNFDDFLEKEGLFAEVEAAAIKKVIAFQIAESQLQEGLGIEHEEAKKQTLSPLRDS